MKGLFCGVCKAKNNDEYRMVLQKRLKKMYLLIVVGVFTLLIGIAVHIWGTEFVEDFQAGIISGFGTGLILGAVLSIIRICGYLKNEEKLKEQRLKETDERELEVHGKAMQAASKVLVAVLYVIWVVGGIFFPAASQICWILIVVFFLSYVLLRKHYERTM